MRSIVKRWLFYVALAWHDIGRLWRTTRYQVVIVTGICLPVLLLLGLKRGHVAELRRELITSPTGRQILCWSAQRGELLTSESLHRLRNDLPTVELIVPETQRVARLDALSEPNNGSGSSPTNRKASNTDESLITLYSTDVGDPVLGQFSADVLRRGEQAVVITSKLATRLAVKAGDTCTLTVFRRKDDIEESHSLQVLVKAIVPSRDDSSQSGYANITFLAKLEQYVRGFAVPELELPAMRGLKPQDEYLSYLLFCQKGQQTDLRPDDLKFFAERGIHCSEVTDQELKGLFGILQVARLHQLKLYELTQGDPKREPRGFLSVSPLFITENTQAVDDFALRWNPPTEFQVDGKSVRLIGLSLPITSQTGGWIRDYLSQPATGFDFESSLKEPFQITFPDNADHEHDTRAVICLRTGEKIPFQIYGRTNQTQSADQKPAIPTPVVIATKEAANNDTRTQRQASAVNNEETNSQSHDRSAPPKSNENHKSQTASKEKGRAPKTSIAVVPANSLAWLRQAMSGKLVYDPISNSFTAQPGPMTYDKARVYTKTIDEVPTVVDQLAASGYAVLSESNRIAEIQDQDRSLQALVVVVGLGVFLFGTVTVIGVLVDATDRKRGTIGILRVMGMSRAGVFFVVILRASIVGICAAGLSICLGAILAWIMAMVSHQTIPLNIFSQRILIPHVSIVFRPDDYFIIGLGALICSGLGAVFPAWRASALDPFDAIVEGKFH